MHECMYVCSIAKGSCNGFAALREGLAMVGQHCESVSQYYCGIARESRNTIAALRMVSAMVWLHCTRAFHGFDEFNCEKAGRDTLKCQTLSHARVAPVATKQRNVFGCLG